MTEISDKLKALGVQIGAKKITPNPRRGTPIEKIIQGTIWNTHYGETFVVEERYPADYLRGKISLLWESPLETMAAWAQEEKVARMSHEAFAFLDTETSGLAGGTGTYVFMAGIGRFEKNEFRLAQFFLRDPLEEPAFLSAIQMFLAPCQAVVTFNGKSFDVPLLNTRFTTQGWPSPFKAYAHLDLLHLARRLWRARLPSRKLSDLEGQILRTARTVDDVPGWLIPDIYFDYLRYGQAEPLKGVFYHNAMDILSLSALLNHMAQLLDQPVEVAEEDLDLFAIAKLYKNLGRNDKAAELLSLCLHRETIPEETLAEARFHLSMVYKKQGDLENAVILWKESAQEGELYAFEELAKVFEHQFKDPNTALIWTESALNLISTPDFPILERIQWKKSLEHRQRRLQNKIKKDY